MAWKLTAPLLLLAWLSAARCSARDGTELLNVCMDAKHHKAKPGPEDQLHGQVWLGCGSVGEGPASDRGEEVRVVGEGLRGQTPHI